MKTKNVIMLPLLSATFLLSACNQIQEDSKESTQSSKESDKSSNDSIETSSNDNFWDDDGNKENKGENVGSEKALSVLEKTIEKTFDSHGLKTEIKPFKGQITGVKYSQKEEEEVKTTNWDALLEAANISNATTHIGEGDKRDDYNFALQMQDIDISSVKYGIGPLFSDGKLGNTINSALKLFGSDLYANVYYSGNEYPNKLFYNLDDKNGKESNLALITKLLSKDIAKILDELGYSVYPDDNPNNPTDFEILSKAYLSLPAKEESDTDSEKVAFDEDSINSYQEEAMDFILALIKGKFKNNVITLKDGDAYYLSFSLSKEDNAKIKQAIDEEIAKLDDDWTYTFKLPINEEETTDIVISKEDLVKISEKINEFDIERFDYEIKYDENVLLDSALKFEMTVDKSIYDSAFETMEPEEGETDKTMIAVTNLKINEKTEYTSYSLQQSDTDEEVLKEHLRSFANIPSTEELAKYPEQMIPKKKQSSDTEENI